MTTTSRITEFENLIGQCSRTTCRAACYRIAGFGESIHCAETGLCLEPDCHIQIVSLLPVRNGRGWMVMARAKLLFFADQPEVWIWVGDIKR
jgi:hypothetical protein